MISFSGHVNWYSFFVSIFSCTNMRYNSQGALQKLRGGRNFLESSYFVYSNIVVHSRLQKLTNAPPDHELWRLTQEYGHPIHYWKYGC